MTETHEDADPADAIAILRRQLDGALAREAALADVLNVINRSPADPLPVFEAILEWAHRLCGADAGSLGLFDGTMFRKVARHGYHGETDADLARPYPAGPEHAPLLRGQTLHVPDVLIHPWDADISLRMEQSGLRTWLEVPIVRDGHLLGTISGWRRQPRAFSAKEIAIMESFAAQAMIAMENARLLTEQREALERQTATAEVLQVINANPGNLAPVFDIILDRAMQLCGVAFGLLYTWDGMQRRTVAARGLPPDFADYIARHPDATELSPLAWRAIESKKTQQIPDSAAGEGYLMGHATARALADLGGARTTLLVPLLAEGTVVGYFSVYRQEIRLFSDKEIFLLESFAAQAVIAMENARLLTEQQQALEQQKASADILTVISTSMGDVQPVFDKILDSCKTLFDGDELDVLLVDERGQLRVAAYVGRFRDEVLATFPAPVDITPAGRAIRERRAVQYSDVLNNPDTPRVLRRMGRIAGYHSVAFAPMLWEGNGIGVIGVARSRGAFTERELSVLQTFAAQAVIAIENARLLTEQQEALARQTATAEVLQVINANPGNLQPVFDAMLDKAMGLCGIQFGILNTWDGQERRTVASRGLPPALEAFFAENPVFGLAPAARRVIDTRQAVQVADIAKEGGQAPRNPIARALVELGGVRTMLHVPLLKDGAAVGYFSLYRQEEKLFSSTETGLLESFAAQAVIAMENARLLTEQQEALERQTATAEVLQVINANPGNLAPVFDAMLERAMRLCDAAFGELHTANGERIDTVAMRGMPEAYVEFRTKYPPTGSAGTPSSRVLASGQPVNIGDMTEEDIFKSGHAIFRAIVELGGVRALLHVPLLKNGVAVGFFAIFRKEVGAFPDKQIALLESFAAQAVIAMENARLLTEQQDALERQTATAAVLAMINSNPGNLIPVFDAMLEWAMRLCGAAFGSLFTIDGDVIQTVAMRGLPEAYVAFRGRNPVMGSQGTPSARTRDTGKPVNIPDMTEEPVFKAGLASYRAIVELGGVRAQLNVPLLRDGATVGFFAIYRKEVGAFAAREIALLENFAAQAVIAMENARLLTEQQEALERQTATAEVLAVINANPGNLVPVFDVVLEKAMRLCQSAFGILRTYDGERVQGIATRGVPEQLVAFSNTSPFVPHPTGKMKRVLETGQSDQDIDLREDEGYRTGAMSAMVAMVDLGGARTVLQVPLIKDRTSIGLITIYRQEVRPFTDKQIALLESFAAQAVIAMENARLLGELRARTDDLQESLDYQTATSDVLKVISRSTFDLQPVLETLLTAAAELCGADSGSIVTIEGDHFRVGTHYARSGREVGSPVGTVVPVTRGTIIGQTILDRRIVHIEDMQADPEIRHPFLLRVTGTMLGVPLLRGEQIIGVIRLARDDVQPFSPRQIELVSTFADQAVIAIENTRLLTEQQEALERQTATAEVLGVINANPGNLAPVFNAILAKAHALCGADRGCLFLLDGTNTIGVAVNGYDEDVAAVLRRPIPIAETGAAQALLTGARYVQTDDIRARAQPPTGTIATALRRRSDVRTSLIIPLRKDGALLGLMSANRIEVRPYKEAEIALLESFAAQAVIAMENARLLNEVRQREDELRVTFENMGDGVAMFDEAHRLVAWNRKFPDILGLPDGTLAKSLAFADFIRDQAARGEYGADGAAQVARITDGIGQARTTERTRPNGRVIEIRTNPVASGGFVVIYADITERKRAEAEIGAARDAAEQATRTIEAAYRDLKIAQANLIQAEKMASLGQLTAGIAHEIKNPLNFVNNFSDLSVELLAELTEAIAPALPALDDDARADIVDLTATLTSNLQKITQHGRRADGIVRAMLEHSRGGSGERRAVDLNAEVEEALNLAFHGARAQDPGFNISLVRDYAKGMAPIMLTPQDITRVFLNLFNNGFYAANKRAKDGAPGFTPVLKVTTRDRGDAVEIRVRDNGIGVPPEIREKLFQPFFTTKPTGEGTGLGLSITYDVVTKQHGGTITVDSELGMFTEFTVTLPRAATGDAA